MIKIGFSFFVIAFCLLNMFRSNTVFLNEAKDKEQEKSLCNTLKEIAKTGLIVIGIFAAGVSVIAWIPIIAGFGFAGVAKGSCAAGY